MPYPDEKYMKAALTQAKRAYVLGADSPYCHRMPKPQSRSAYVGGTLHFRSSWFGNRFFSGCTLKCVFCQNQNIASGYGKTISVSRLSEIFFELQKQGANNINLVTPTHFVPQIAEALEFSRIHGLLIPVVYNTESYEHTETLKRLAGLIDIYLPDLKYFSPKLSGDFSHARDYFSYASLAIAEMVRQTGAAVFGASDTAPKAFESEPSSKASDYSQMPLLKRGVIVRHLILPGHTKDSKKIMEYLYHTYGN